MWESDHEEGWTPKNWYFQIVVLKKILESPLDSMEIKPVNPKGNQPWIFIGRTDAEAEAPILWPPDAKSLLIGKDHDAGKDWRWKEKEMTEDEMVGWHHWLNGHEFEYTRERSEGVGAWHAAVHGSQRVGHSLVTEQQHCLHSLSGWPHPVLGFQTLHLCWECVNLRFQLPDWQRTLWMSDAQVQNWTADPLSPCQACSLHSHPWLSWWPFPSLRLLLDASHTQGTLHQNVLLICLQSIFRYAHFSPSTTTLGQDPFKIRGRGFPGASVIKNLPASAGDTGSIPAPRRSHTPWRN